ncbi:ABC transporter ATP-binding protein [Streptomyces millisiae]|uniref:ABC transporter ATP-binding protein n=1 Tax=Streptomyces millisiae TaxID=3075542 RepID=A0ABU2LIE7_9ACTN|nr:ABC transporter ATP-binding protein [Streptomyces sp. DSM 44918]MDT0317013.1 ABC transporter ATP-binding protein [Streptomyces sp. DSM 44918]
MTDATTRPADAGPHPTRSNTEPSAPLLRVSDLRTEFRTRHGLVRAVNGVSFDVHPGDVLGIVGESGSGKSVTARSIMRMVRPPGKVVGGSVEFAGEDLLSLPEREMRRRRGGAVALVFQDPQAVLNPVMRIGDQIVEALTLHGTDKRAARRRALDLLDQVGIPDAATRIDHYPHQFSGGMRQRVVIAIALANDPALLIADEPTTALDVTIQAQILRLLLRLRAELGLAIAIITHDMGVVAEMCTRVAVMYGGRVVEQGTVEQVLGTPRHPYTAALLAAMPRIDDDRVGEPLPAIPGSPPDPAALPAGCAFAPRCRYAEDACREQIPELLGVGEEGQLSACFVAHRGDGIGPATDDDAPERAAATVTVTEVRAPRPADSVPVLEVRDLRVDVGSRRRGVFRRDAPVFAVDSVSLAVRAGETLGLVGESGCGKSTLSRAVVGITPVAGGSVLVDGQDVTAMAGDDLGRVRSSVQYVFQDPYASLNPRRTIRQSLAEALSLRGLRGSALEREARSLMTRVGLRADHLDRYPQAFSGGQRQRIGIARALAREPKVLILDEPVSALDMSIQAQIINLLEELQDELDLGYLFIAHDLSVVRHLSDRVAVMYLGRIVETGSAASVYGNPRHPYTAALLSSSPVPSLAERERERVVLRGDLPSPADPPSGCRFRTRCPVGPLTRPERTVCVEVAPEPRSDGAGGQVACHFAGELS